jgi:hypothetical protein
MIVLLELDLIYHNLGVKRTTLLGYDPIHHNLGVKIVVPSRPYLIHHNFGVKILVPSRPNPIYHKLVLSLLNLISMNRIICWINLQTSTYCNNGNKTNYKWYDKKMLLLFILTYVHNVIHHNLFIKPISILNT